jgi:hypothetical protein
MSLAFQDLNFDQAKIDSNYTWKQIDIVQNNSESKIFDDLAQDIVVAPNKDNTFDVADTGLTLYGTNLTNTNSDNVVSIGHNSNVVGSDRVVNIGNTNLVNNSDAIVNISGFTSNINASDTCINIGGNDNVSNSNNVINIGYDTTIGSNITSNNNIIIGNNNDNNGVNNVLIGSGVKGGGLNVNNIVIGTQPQGTEIPEDGNGSIILGTGPTASGMAEPSALPRFQLLGDNLTNLRGQGINDPFDNDVNAEFAIPNINGYMRIKYKNRLLLIPAILDVSDANPTGPPLPPPPPP